MPLSPREALEKWIWIAQGPVHGRCANPSVFDALIAEQRARLAAMKGQKKSVTPQFILQGATYALEQCGLLLRDAKDLYRNGGYGNTVVLTAFAREELGRSAILLDFWQKASAGEAFTVEQLEQACEDHIEKQRAGMLSLTLRADQGSGVGKTLSARMTNHPQSAEWKEADTTLKQIDDIKKRRTPSDRHDMRVKALYVEPTSETEWNRPALTSAVTAYEFLADSVNDYSGRYHQGYTTPGGMLQHIDHDLHMALEQWPERPVSPSPEHPEMPALTGD